MTHLHLVVLSGGLDSATALGMACRSGAPLDRVEAITFEYGQRHALEVIKAQELAEYYGVDHSIIPLPQSLFVGGVLTTDAEVPDMKYSDLPDGEMSPAYVPFRNGNLLSMAAARADSILQTEINPPSKATIWAGMHAEDAQGFAYADCTPELLGAMAVAIHIGTYTRVRLHCPFQTMTKAEIVKKGFTLGVPYKHTMSCYRGEEPACGTCATCRARLEAFERAGMQDPIHYAERV